MPRVYVMPNTIGALELHGVRGRVKDMPQRLLSLTLVLPHGLGSAYAAAYLNKLPETVHSLALDASQCQANLADLALPARLRTLRLTHLRELPALPTSLTSITLESCSLRGIVQLPPSVTNANLSETWCRVDNFAQTSVAVMGSNLCRLRLTGLQPTWAVPPLPQGLTDLHIDFKSFYHSLSPGFTVALTVLPQSLEVLTLSCGFGGLNFTLGALPYSLRTLDTTHFLNFNSALGQLPDSLTHLSLGWGFYHALGALPAGLMELRFAGNFNRPLGTLPPSLRVLDLHQCCRFNHPLGCLPRALRQLRLGAVFNQPLLLRHASLPAVHGQQAATQALGARLAADPLQPTPGALVRLPETLAVLHIGEAFDHPLGPLPKSLTQLRVGRCCCDCRFSHALGPLPAALRVLQLGVCAAYNHALNRLPDALRELRVFGAFDQPLPQLPACLEVLALGDAFDQTCRRRCRERCASCTWGTASTRR
ncbi:hypothetical protein JKP88DRAFT_252603 [Tribonema minus]|uniref:Uncharacterized protein n=1 Tax=Tribonema minus TaxID=303371 RepID=A0A835ZB84_9STRA|nr:hypothetical protein JKP88DRAFT_252603 [Tribonema minus]